MNEYNWFSFHERGHHTNEYLKNKSTEELLSNMENKKEIETKKEIWQDVWRLTRNSCEKREVASAICTKNYLQNKNKKKKQEIPGLYQSDQKFTKGESINIEGFILIVLDMEFHQRSLYRVQLARNSMQYRSGFQRMNSLPDGETPWPRTIEIKMRLWPKSVIFLPGKLSGFQI